MSVAALGILLGLASFAAGFLHATQQNKKAEIEAGANFVKLCNQYGEADSLLEVMINYSFRVRPPGFTQQLANQATRYSYERSSFVDMAKTGWLSTSRVRDSLYARMVVLRFQQLELLKKFHRITATP